MTVNEFNLLPDTEKLSALTNVKPFGSLRVAQIRVVHFKLFDFCVTAWYNHKGQLLVIRGTFNTRVLNVHPNLVEFEELKKSHESREPN